jgi:hypothetical protein
MIPAGIDQMVGVWLTALRLRRGRDTEAAQ